MTMHLFLEAPDVWLFRDGKPFDVGADNRARSIFPPNPETIQGALRSAELMRRDVSLSDYARGARQCVEPGTRLAAEVVGWPGEYGQLRLNGPWLAREQQAGGVERFFPFPADLVRQSSYRLLMPMEQSPFITNAPVPVQLLWRSGPPVSEKQDKTAWLLEEGSLRAYLAGEIENIRPTSDKCLFVRESRFGVAIDSQKQRYREGQLFQIEYVRPCPGVGLSVLVDGLNDWPEQGSLALGGDARVAGYRQVVLPQPLPTSIPGARFKVYFMTPAYFEQGWRPADWSHYFDGQVGLVAAALGRPASIGGWDLVKRWPKPLQRFVPAGSVFYFEAQGSVAYKNIPLTEYGAEIGYGQICISSKEWSYV